MRANSLTSWAIAVLILSTHASAQTADTATDALPQIQIVNLTLWQLDVPEGGVSGSAEFWKRINEPIVDVATNDLLLKNGFRVGMGSAADWPRYKKILEDHGVRMRDRHYYSAHAAKDQVLWMSGDLPEQTLFFYDAHGLTGKVYDGCKNRFTVTYEPAPRKSDTIRLQVCPGVESLRKHYRFSSDNNEDVIEYVADEHMYDLNLRVDVAPGNFVVIAPSTEARRTASLGHQFLTMDENAGRVERVLMFFSDARPELSDATPSTKPAKKP